MENHCEIHAPLNPEWPLVKCARVEAEEEERKEIGGGITHPTPDTLLQMRRESQDLNDYKLSTDCMLSLRDGVKMLSPVAKLL